jgi:tellurite resistance protein TerC
MGDWTLWIAFNAGVAVLLVLDLALFHRRPHAVTLGEAAIESAAWVALSGGFGAWIFVSHGRGPGLEFFAGYVIEKSLSLDNVFVFLLVFQYFRVEPRYQHRLLFWGVLGALVLRGAMIGAGTVLVEKFSWILYLFGAFLLFAGLKLLHADHSVHPEKNTLLRWAQKILPMASSETGPNLVVRRAGRWLLTPLFLVVIVLETTDLVLAVDSIPAVFGVTRDPFLVYSSNVCAVLGLRAFYFLLAGILPYFRHLDEGLGVVLIFIGAKMIGDPWVHISAGKSLAIVGGIIAVAVLASVLRVPAQSQTEHEVWNPGHRAAIPPATPELISHLADPDPAKRVQTAWYLLHHATMQIAWVLADWRRDDGLRALLVEERIVRPHEEDVIHPQLTAGIAVTPELFNKIWSANGSPPLADAPADQDVIEFELEFPGNVVPRARLDILTTKALGEKGAIARFLEKFGEAIQQVEIEVTDVDGATEILRKRFQLEPVYPVTRTGSNATRVNFFLVTTWSNKKALIELVEQPKRNPYDFPYTGMAAP